MQLILDAENSEINIREKMTTVEDSVSKLTNGVDIEKAPEKEIESNLNPEKDNSLNGDIGIESEKNIESVDKTELENVPAAPCEDEGVSKNSDTKSKGDSHTILDDTESTSKNESNGSPSRDSSRVDIIGETERNLEENEEPKENCEQKLEEPEDGTKLDNYVNKLETERPVENLDQKEKENVNMDDNVKEYCNENKHETEEPVENLSNMNDIKRDYENKLETQEPEENLKQTSKENEHMEGNIAEKNAELSEMGEKKNSEEQKNEKTYSDSGDVEPNVDSHKIVDKGNEEHSKVLVSVTKDNSNIIKEHNLDNEITDIVSNVIMSETLSDNTASHIQAPISPVDNTEVSTKKPVNGSSNAKESDMDCDVTTIMPINKSSDAKADMDSDVTNKMPINESSDSKEADMDCDVTNKMPIDESSNAREADMDCDVTSKIPINENSNSKESDMYCDVAPSSVEKKLNESAPTPMDCDNLDLIEKDKNESLMDHKMINETTPKEDTQVDQTNSLAVEAINEPPETFEENNESLMDHAAINEKDDFQVNKTNSLAIGTVNEESEKVKENTMKETTETKENQIPEMSVSTVVQEIETSKEDVTKVNETSEKAIEVKETSSLEESKEIGVQEDSIPLTASSPSKEVNSDIEEVKVIDIDMEEKSTKSSSKSNVEKPTPTVCKLSNTLNILSDDEDESPKREEIPESSSKPDDKQCINIEDDDDVMVIEDTVTQDKPESISSEGTSDKKDFKSDSDSGDAKTCEVITEPEPKCNDEKESSESKIEFVDSPKPQITEIEAQETIEEKKKELPLLPKDLFKSYKKNLTEMTRDDLEEFCILKIVESIIDRSSLNEIKTRLKTMSQTMEEYKKKAMMLTKQNRDLQVVLKSVQEEQKKGRDTPIVPLKITRSVGMQVLMTDKNARRKVNPTPSPSTLNANNRVARVNQNPRQQAPITNQHIPVPRLVPATNTATKPNPVQANVIATRNTTKANNALSNGVKSSPPVPKAAEKRTRVQSVTVDLTDDEPPAKIPANKTSPAPPVRLVPSQNLLTPRAQMASNTLNNPRKVYIPIGSNQNQNVRPGQTIMLKNVPNTGPRPRGVAPMGPRGQTPNQIRMPRVNSGRHPAPLPDAVKQYQPPNWKALPPAPDLKLSKVENGIVISWKIDGYQEDSYEEIASYQLYAYQETSSAPQTSLWKKIGDVKALPLPMACTLTQFMAGYKYYFAVRAVDVRSRLGPFSLPGSILLLNKM